MDKFTSSGVVTAPAAPPPEVKIRTMRSDLDLLAKSGGGLPQFQKIKVSGLSTEQRATTAQVERTASQGNLLYIFLGVVLVIALAVAGWFAYLKFFANAGGGFGLGSGAPQVVTSSSTPLSPPASAVPIPPAPTETAAGMGATGASTTTTVSAPAIYSSFFQTPADQVLSLVLPTAGAAQNATDLETYNQKVSMLLSGARTSAKLIEIRVSTADGHTLAANDLFAAQSVQLLASSVVSADFMPYATFFAYRSNGTFWPGYVLKLDPGISWTSLQTATQQLESSISISNIFLINAGTAAASGFTGSTLASTPVRVLAFSGGAAATDFVYGWTPDHQYLVLSSSEAGFTAALGRL
jgi:hypothetical protein